MYSVSRAFTDAPPDQPAYTGKSQVEAYCRHPQFDRDLDSGLIPKQMFWPPRVVRAAQNGSLLVFFGSGVSLAAGLPNWIGLLRKGGLDDDLEKDPHVSDDMLKLAELAARNSAIPAGEGIRRAQASA